jgi:hypothetical protein
MLLQQSELAQLQGEMRLMERKLSKMQSRVLICAEQFRTVRGGTDEMRATVNDVLATHGTALAEVVEQTNSLQKVVSSMQDVVVKQIKVQSQRCFDCSSLSCIIDTSPCAC